MLAVYLNKLNQFWLDNMMFIPIFYLISIPLQVGSIGKRKRRKRKKRQRMKDDKRRILENKMKKSRSFNPE